MCYSSMLALAFLAATAAPAVNRNYSDVTAMASPVSAGAQQPSAKPPARGTNASPPVPGSDGSNKLTDAMAALEQGTLTVWVPRTFLRGNGTYDQDLHWDTWFLPKFKQDFPNFDLHFEVMEREQLEKAMGPLLTNIFPMWRSFRTSGNMHRSARAARSYPCGACRVSSGMAIG